MMHATHPTPNKLKRDIYIQRTRPPSLPTPFTPPPKKIPPMQNAKKNTRRGVYKYNKHNTHTQNLPSPSSASNSTKRHPHLLLASKLILLIKPGVMAQDAGIRGARWDSRDGDGRVGLRFGI